MSNIKRNTLLILLVFLVFLAVPMSFASDVNATDLGSSDAPSDIVQYSDDSVLSDEEHGFYIHENPIEINEGESATITGEIMGDGINYYGELNFKYSYVDSNGISRFTNLNYDAYDDTEFTVTISGLTAAKSPYIVTFSVINDDLYEEYQWYNDPIEDEQVTITVIGADAPIEDPAVPEYTTLTPQGQLYVDDSTGDDENDGSEAAPYKTIQAALDQNAALGGNYEVIVNAGTYNVAGYTISKPVRITGRGKVIIDAQKTDYHFSTSANTIEFYNLVFINGKGTVGSLSGSTTTGGSGNTGKVLNIINCTFKDNSGSIGVLRSYATTTILYSNFINNNATYAAAGWGNIIYSADSDLTVKFCNFINNNPKSDRKIIDSVNKADANYNFWGSNDGPSASAVGDKVTAKAWVVVDAALDATALQAGNNYTITIKNKYVKGDETNDLAIPMAELEVDLFAEEGTITPSTVNVSNNLGQATYTAPDSPDDAIIVKTYSNTLKTINIDEIEPAPGPVYVTNVTPSSVNYVLGESSIVTVTATYDPIYADDLSYGSMFVYINGEEIANRVKVEGIDASATSLEFDLASISDKLIAGENTLTFHPHPGNLEGTVSGEYVFNPLTVIVSSLAGTSIVGDNLVMDYKDGSTLNITLVDSNGSPISGARIYVNNTLKEYKYNTNDQGIVSVPVNLKVGEYTFAIRYDGNDVYQGLNATRTVTVNKADTIISVEDVTVTYKENDNYTVTLTDVNGNPIKNALINVNNSEKVLKYRTDANGVANVPVTLKPKNYTFTVSFDGNDLYKASTNSSTVVVDKAKANIDASNLVITYKDGATFDATLTDTNGVAISGATVKFDFMVDGVVKKSVRYRTDANGVASAPISVKPGDYECAISFAGNSLYGATNVTKTLTVNKAPANLEASNTEITYKNGNLTARLTDVDGNAIVGATVSFTQGTSTYRYHTDANGVATAPINLKPGDYNYTVSFNGNSLNGPVNKTVVLKVNKIDPVLTAEDITMTFKDGTNYTAKLTDANGNPLVGVVVKLNRTGSTSTYKYKTDSEGMISVPLNFKVGTYDFVAFIEESDIYNPASVATTVTITK